MDGLGFMSVGSTISSESEQVGQTTDTAADLSQGEAGSVVAEGTADSTSQASDVIEAGGDGTITEQASSDSSADAPTVVTETAVKSEPVKETVYVDPFAELGDTERAIFESIKNKDYSSLKGILDAVTANYDNVSDIDLIRQQIKESKPRWTDEMIDAEMVRKYGIGLDEDEMSPIEKLTYQMQLLDDGDAARSHFKGKQAEIKFPELTANQPKVEAEKTQTQSPEEIAKFREYWNGHIDNSVNGLTDEVIKIEVGRDGNKEIFDFPIAITPEDKQSLKALVSDYDLNKDFQDRYVKDNVIDLKKFMSDRFKADNFDKLLKAAFAQGHSKGKLNQIAGDKNLNFENKPHGSGTHEQVAQRTKVAEFFLSNGRNK